ncbi:MAG: acyl-CoA synthetase (NDP forming) [Gammaproteobacteria bacterium]|jgi:acyl-CoA synthetase (NDP forming)
MSDSTLAPTGLDALMAPRSVAVIGASDDATRIGGRPLHYLLERGFRGPLYPVNPRRETVQGVAALANIADAPGPVDLAVVAVPAAAVLTALEECAAKGVGAAVVFSSGFAEMGDEGLRGQQAIAAIARDSGMRIVGPNCLGVYNTALNMYATFSSSIELQSPEPGSVGVVSQSGAYGAHIAYLARSRRVQVGYLITTGNECDVEVAECIEWMARCPDVKVIAASAEGLRDGDALCRALECARAARKPVVFLKMGRSSAGAEAAMSHTASLAGSDAVYDAVFREFGAYRAQDTDELLDVAYAASFGVLPADERIGLISVSGGMGIQMADAAERNGLPLEPMPEATQQRLLKRLPFSSPRNPVDITAQMFNDHGLLGENLDAMLAEAGYTSIVGFFTYVAGTAFMADRLIDTMSDARARFPDRLLVLSIIASEAILARYEAIGCPCFEDADRAVRAVAALARIARAFAQAPALALSLPPPLSAPLKLLDEDAALQVLAQAGLPAAARMVAATADEAVQVANKLGYPLALKIRSVDIAHKSDVGGVHLALQDAQAVSAAFEAATDSARAAAPSARIDGVLLSPMAAPGIDMILGSKCDALFGPVVMVGLGGIFVEVMEDVALARAPFDAGHALAMLRGLKAWPLLDGARGGKRADVAALCEAMVALSRFAAANAATIDSIDVNPLRVFAQGEGACMLDALIQLAAP